MRDASTLLAAIANFHPDRSTRASSGEQWLELDDLVQQLHAAGAPALDVVRVLLGVFERFPRHDGYEVFWSLLHYLETLPGYEPELIASVRRVPNEMGIIMLRRIANGGVAQVDGVDLAALICELTPQAPAIDFFVDPPLQ